MEVLDTERNFIRTECGHCFHASCLMKHTAFNGYECPYCRFEMTTKPENNEESDEESDEDSESSIEPEIQDDGIAESEREEYTLNGFRWMFQQNIDGKTENIDDMLESYEEWLKTISRSMVFYKTEYEGEVDWRLRYIMKRIEETNIITFEDAIKARIFEMDQYFEGSNLQNQNRKVNAVLSNILDEIKILNNRRISDVA